MSKHLVLQTDFGLSDGAVSAMYGVSLSVNPELKIFNLTHDIPQFNIWEGSYRLYQTISYWPEGTVFVSVVDPGVGTDRLSIVVKTKSGHYIVTPDNGTLTHIATKFGIEAVREIDESKNRLPNSGESYTFHGRDVYAFTGARLASGVIDFEGVGDALDVEDIILLDTPEVSVENVAGETVISGVIDILDIRFGNVWTNIARETLVSAGVAYGDVLEVSIQNHKRQVFQHSLVYTRSFAAQKLGEGLIYVNSLDNIGVGINQGSFAKAYHIGTGNGWKISLTKKN